MAYSLVWGQCTDLLRAKVEALNNYAQIKRDSHVLALLREIKGITFKFEDQCYVPHLLYQAYRSFYNLRQKPKDTNTQYLKQFNNTVDIIEQYGGSLGNDSALIVLVETKEGMYANDLTCVSSESEDEEEPIYFATPVC